MRDEGETNSSIRPVLGMGSVVSGASSANHLYASSGHADVPMDPSVALFFLAGAEVGGEGVSLRN